MSGSALLRGALAAGFAAAGLLHLVAPRPFVAIVPAGFPNPPLLVAISGIAEIAGAAGLLLRGTRDPAAWGLVALLAAVFPANVAMAQHAERFAALAPAWVLWARLPLQPLLAVLVLRARRA